MNRRSILAAYKKKSSQPSNRSYRVQKWEPIQPVVIYSCDADNRSLAIVPMGGMWSSSILLPKSSGR